MHCTHNASPIAYELVLHMCSLVQHWKSEPVKFDYYGPTVNKAAGGQLFPHHPTATSGHFPATSEHRNIEPGGRQGKHCAVEGNNDGSK